MHDRCDEDVKNFNEVESQILIGARDAFFA